MATQGILEDLKLSVPLADKVSIPGVSVDLQQIDRAAGEVLGSFTQMGFETLLALALVTLGWVASRWLASATQRALVRARMEETVAAFLGSMARYAFFLTCIVVAINALGVSLTGTVAIFGAIGLAVAFALRNTLGHVASGLMLIVNRPFRVGDFIELDGPAGTKGTVKRITMFNTEINTLQNQRVFIPNTRIWDNVLQNHSYNEVRAIEMTVGFGYDDAPEHCKRVLREIFAAEPLILNKPEPYVSTEAMTDFAVVYLFRVWVRTRDLGAVRSTILDKVLQAARHEGLSIPYPQRVVHMADEMVRKPRGRKR